MAHTFLVFEFGTSEESAQQARHRIEGWKQAFRLGKKIELKFERIQPEAEQKEVNESDAPSSKKKAKEKEAEASSEEIRLIVRLDFSDHERLSYHRWLDRIPIEEPFKSVKSQIVRYGEDAFEETAKLFDSLI
jgi:hypothetical protein